MEEQLKKQVESFLHIDWAFKDAHGKPDKIVIEGYPKGGYHLSYTDFVNNVVSLIQKEKQSLLEQVEGLLYASKTVDATFPEMPMPSYEERKARTEKANSKIDSVLKALATIRKAHGIVEKGTV